MRDGAAMLKEPGKEYMYCALVGDVLNLEVHVHVWRLWIFFCVDGTLQGQCSDYSGVLILEILNREVQ